MERCRLLLLLAILVAVAHSERIGHSNYCANKCEVSIDEVRTFPTGKSLTYDYEGHTFTTIKDSTKDHSGLKIKARVHIDVFSPCDMAMRLSEVELHELDPRDPTQSTLSARNSEFARSVTIHPFHFATEPQRQEKVSLDVHHVCQHPEEPEWVTNFKKGLLSNLQHRMKDRKTFQRDTETDILGRCPVSYIPLPSSDDSKIFTRKVKDLNSCTQRDHHFTSLPSTDYRLSTLQQTLPIMNSTHTCDHIFNNERLESVSCSENHLFRPLSNQDKGITTQIYQKMIFLQESTVEKPKSAVQLKASFLQFKHKSIDNKKEKYAFNMAKIILKELCQTRANGVQESTPSLFSELVYKFRKLTRDQLETIRSEVKQGTICETASIKAYFYDALAYANTAASTDIMVDATIQGELSGSDINSWLTGLAFQKKAPTTKFIKSLLPIVKHNSFSTKSQTLLGLSSLIHLYCQSQTDHCDNDEVIDSILLTINTILGDDCQNSDHNDGTGIRLALKSLGNMGLKKTAPLLTKCAKRVENPISVRIAALDAFRRVPCSTDRASVLPILENFDNDSELRIRAYLAVMTCPDTETLFKVKSLLAREKVNQVGSFIWTHLTNLRETSNPHKQQLRQILEDSSLRAEFNLDKLKFSRNVEKSYLSPVWNIGGQLESNLIWSQNSFLPRSASLNLTADMYGRAYNFINLEARVEGLESLLERLIGPEGYLTKSKALSKTNTQKVYIDALKKIEGSLGIQVFGQEIAFYDLVKGSITEDNQFNIFDILTQLGQEKEIDFTKNLMLADSTVSFATGMGLPMKIDFNSTATIQIKSTTKFSIGNFFNDVSIISDLKPSAALKVSGVVSMEAGLSKYGVRLISTLHSNTHVKAKISSQKFETFDFKLDVPQENQQIISFSSDAFVIHPDYERPVSEQTTQLKVKEFCSNKMTEEFFGIKVCSRFSYPDLENLSQLPLAGSVRVGVSMHKTDTQEGYKLSATLKSVKHPSGYISKFIRFEMDTPKSTIPRQFLGDLTLDVAKRIVKAEFITPWKSAVAEFGLQNDDEQKRMVARIQIDKFDLVRIEGSQTTEMTASQETIDTTKFVFNIPSFTKKPITALLKSQKSKNLEVTVNFSIDNLFNSPVRGRTVIQYRQPSRASLGGKYVFSGEYETMFGNGVIQGSSQRSSVLNKFQASLSHMSPESTDSKPYVISLLYKINDKSNDALTKVFVETSVSHGYDQENVYRMNLETEKADSHIKSKYNIQYGHNGNGRDSADMKTLSGQVYTTLTVKGDKKMLDSGYTLNYPSQSINHEAKLSASWSPALFVSTLSVKNENEQILYIGSRYVANYDILKINTGFSYKTTQHNLELESEIKESSLHSYDLITRAAYNGKQYLTANGNLRIPNLWNVQASGSLSFGAQQTKLAQKPIKFTISYDARDPSDASLHIEFLSKPHGINHSMKLTHFSEINQRFYDYRSELTLKSPRDKIRIAGIAKNKPGDMHHEATLQLSELRKYAVFTKSVASPEGESKNELSFSAGVNYPGRDMKLNLDWVLEHLKMNAQIGLQWEKDRLISVHSMYDIDDGWTQKGLVASLTVNTPFTNYKQTHLGINALGQLRYRRVDIEYKWGNKKRIRLDVVVEPKSAQDFLATITLITPYPRMSYLSIHGKYQLTDTHLTTSAICHLGPKEKYALEFGVSNDGYYENNDIKVNLKVQTGRESKDITVNFHHKDSPQSAKSNLKVDFMQQTSVEAGYDLVYKLAGYFLETQGSLFVKSSHPQIGDNQFSWSHANNEEKFETLLSAVSSEEDVMKSNLKIYRKSDNSKINLDADIKVVGMNQPSSAKLRYRMNENEGRLSLDLFIIPEYDYRFIALSEGRRDSHITLVHEMKLKTAHSSLPYIEFSNVETRPLTTSQETFLKKSTGKLVYGSEKKIIFEYNEEERYENEFWISKMKCRSAFKPLNGLEINAKIRDVLSEQVQYFLDINNKQGMRFVFDHIQNDQYFTTVATLSFPYRDDIINGSYQRKVSNEENSFDLGIEHSVEGKHRLFYKLIKGSQIDFDLNLSYLGVQSIFTVENAGVISSKFYLKTPSVVLKYIDMSLSYDPKNGHTHFIQITETKWGTYRSLAVFQLRNIDNFRIELKFDSNGREKTFNFINLRDVSTKLYKTQFDLNANTEIHLNSVLRLQEPFKLNFSLDTNFQPLQTIRVSFLNQMEYPNSIRHIHAIKFKSYHRALAIENRFEMVGSRYLNIKAHLLLPNNPRPVYLFSYGYNRRPSGLVTNIKMEAFASSAHASLNLGQNRLGDVRFSMGSSHPGFKNLNVLWRTKSTANLNQVSHISLLDFDINHQIAHFANKLEWVLGSKLDYLSMVLNGSIPEVLEQFLITADRQKPNNVGSMKVIVNDLTYFETALTTEKQLLNLPQNEFMLTHETNSKKWTLTVNYQKLDIYKSTIWEENSELKLNIIARNKYETSPIANLKLKLKQNGKAIELIFASAYLSDTVTGSAEIQSDNDEHVRISGRATVPFHSQFKNNEMELVVDKTNKRASLTAKMGDSDYITAEVNVKKVFVDIELPNINNVKVQFNNEMKDDGTLTRRLEIHLKNKWSSPILYTYEVNKEITGTEELNTPTELGGVRYINVVTFDRLTWNYEQKLSYNSISMTQPFTVDFKLDQTEKFNIKLIANSPWRIKTVNIDFKEVDMNTLEMKASVNEITVNSKLQIHSNLIDLSVECSEYQSPLKIHAEYTEGKVKASYSSPLVHFESGDIEVIAELPGKLSANIVLSILPKPITANWIYSDSTIRVKLTSPCSYAENVNLQATWNENSGSVEIHHNLLSDSIRISFTYSKFTKLRVHLKTPIDGLLKDVSLDVFRTSEAAGRQTFGGKVGYLKKEAEVKFYYSINSPIEYSFNVDVNVPTEEPITLTASYHSKPNNDLIEQDFKLTSSLLSEDIDLSAKINRFQFTFFQFNLNANPIKLFSKINIQPSSGEIKLSFEKLSENYSFDGEWRVDEKLSSVFLLQTPFDVMKKTLVTLDSYLDRKSLMTVSELKFTHNMLGKYEAVLELSTMSAQTRGLTLQVTTPFAKFETSKISFSLAETKLIIGAESSALSEPISLTFQWELIGKIQMNFKLTTPFDHARSVTFEATYAPQENNQRLLLETNKLGVLSATLNSQYPDYELTVATPFADFQQNKITLRVLKEKSYEIKATSPKLTQPIVLNLNLNLVEPSLSLQTPFNYLQTTELKGKLQIEKEQITVVVSFMNNYLGEYSVEGQRTRKPEEMKFGLKISTPFANYKIINVDATLKREEFLLTFSKTKMTQPITINVLYNLFGESKSLETKINTPFMLLKSFHTKLDLISTPENKKIALDFNYNDQLTLNKVLKWNVNSDGSFKLEFDGTTNQKGYEKSQFSLSLEKPDNRVEFKVDIPALNLDFQVHAQYLNAERLSASFQLTTNYKNLKTNGVSLDMIYNAAGQIQTAELKMNQEKLGSFNLKSEMKTHSDKREEIVITGEVIPQQGGKHNMEIKLSKLMSVYQLECTSTSLSEPITMKLTISERSLDVEVTSQFIQIKQLSGRVSLVNGERLVFHFKHNLIGEFSQEINWKMDGSSDINLWTKTMYNQNQLLFAKFEVKNSILAIYFNTPQISKPIEITGQFSLQYTKLEMKTPFPIQDTLIQFKTTYITKKSYWSSGQIQAAIDFKFENTVLGKLGFDSTLNSQPGEKFDFTMKLSTPVRNYENFSASFTVETNKMNAMMNMDSFKQPISLSVEWKLSESLDISTTFTSPLEMMKLLDVKIVLPREERFSPLSLTAQLNDNPRWTLSHNCQSSSPSKMDCLTVVDVTGYQAKLQLQSDTSYENQNYVANFNSNKIGEYELMLNRQIGWTRKEFLKLKTPGITRSFTFISDLQAKIMTAEISCSRNGLWKVELSAHQMSIKWNSSIRSGSAVFSIKESSAILKMVDDTSRKIVDVQLTWSLENILLLANTNFEGFETLNLKLFFSLPQKRMEISSTVNERTTALTCLISTLKIDSLNSNCVFNNQLISALPTEWTASLDAKYSSQVSANKKENFVDLKLGSHTLHFTISKVNNKYSLEIQTPFALMRNMAFNYVLDYDNYVTLNKFAVDATVDSLKYGVIVSMVAKPNSLKTHMEIQVAALSTKFVIDAKKVNQQDGNVQTYVEMNEVRLAEINTQWLFSSQTNQLKWNMARNNDAILNIDIDTKLIKNKLTVGAQFKILNIALRGNTMIEINQLESSNISLEGHLQGYGLEKSISGGFQHSLVKEGDVWTLKAAVDFMGETYNGQFNFDKQNIITITLKSNLRPSYDITFQFGYQLEVTSLQVLAAVEQSILGGRYASQANIVWEKPNLVTKFIFQLPSGDKYELNSLTNIVKENQAVKLTSYIGLNNIFVNTTITLENGQQKSIFLEMESSVILLKRLLFKGVVEWSASKIYFLKEVRLSGLNSVDSTFSFNIVPEKMEAMGQLKVNNLKWAELQFLHKTNSDNTMNQYLGFMIGDRYSGTYQIQGKFTPLFIGTVEIVTPIQDYRKIILKGSLNAENEISYALIVDDSENLMFEIGNNGNDEQWENKIRLQIPNKSIAVTYVKNRRKRSVTANIESSNQLKSVKLEYEPTEEGFEGKMMVPQTDFMPRVTIHIKHDKSENNENTFTHRLTAGEHSAELIGDIRQEENRVRMNARMSSSFNGGKEILFSAQRQHHNNRYNFDHSLKYKHHKNADYQHFRIRGEYNLNPRNLDGFAVVNTPFHNMKHVEAKYSHSIERLGHFQFNHQLIHGETPLFHIKGEYALRPQHYKFHTIVKCHRKYHHLLPKHFEILSTHSIVGEGKHEFTHHLIYSPQLLKTQFQGHFIPTSEKVEANLLLKTPIRRFGIVQIKVTDNRKPDTAEREFSHTLHLNEEKIIHLKGLYLITRNNAKGSVDITSTIPYLKKLNIEALHHLANRQGKHHFSFHHHRMDRPLSFDSFIDLNNQHFGSIKIASPFHRVATFNMDWQHSGAWHEHHQSANCHLNSRKIFIYSGRVSLADKRLHHQIDLPLMDRQILSEIKLENSIASILMKCSTSNRSNFIQVQHGPTETVLNSNLLKLKVERLLTPSEKRIIFTVNDSTNVQLQMKKKNEEELYFAMENNFLALNSLDATVKTTSGDKELVVNWSYNKIRDNLSLTLTNTKFSLDSTYPTIIKARFENSDKFFVETVYGDVFSMTIDQSGQSKKFSLLYQSHFIHSLKIEALSDSAVSRFSMITKLTPSQSENILEIKLENKNFLFRLSTELPLVPEITITIQPVNAANGEYKAIITCNDRTATVNLAHNDQEQSFDLASDIPYIARCKFNLQSKNAEMIYSRFDASTSDMSVNAKWTWSDKLTNVDITSDLANEKLTLNLNLQNEENNRQVGAKLTSTFAPLRTLKGDFALRTPENKIFVEADFRYNTHRVTVHRIVFTNDGSTMKALVKVSSTCHYMRSINLDSSAKYSNDQIDASLTVNVNEFTFNSEMTKKSNTITAIVSALNRKLDVTLSPQLVSATYSTNDLSRIYSVKLDFISINDLTIEITSPCLYMKQVKVTLWQDIKARNIFKHKSTVTYNGVELLNVNLDFDLPSGKANIVLINPVEGSLLISQPKSNEIQVEIQSNNQKYSIGTTWNLESSNREVNVIITTPFRKSQTDVVINDDRISAKFIPNMRKSNKVWQITLARENGHKITISTPLRSVSIRVLRDTTKSANGMQSEIEVVWKGSELTKTFSLTHVSNIRPHQLTSTMELRIPYLKAPIVFENTLKQKPGQISIDMKAKLTENPSDDVLLSVELKNEPLRRILSATLSRKSTNLLVSVQLNAEHSDTRCKLSVDMKHLNEQNIEQSSSLLLERELGKSFTFSLRTPVKSITLKTFKSMENEKMSYNIELTRDNNKISAKLAIESEGVNFQIHHNPTNLHDFVQVYLKYVNDRHIQAALIKQQNTKQTQFFLAYIKLKTEHILQGSVDINPKTQALLQAFSGMSYSGVQNDLETDLNEIFNYYSKEIETLLLNILKPIDVDFRQTMTYIAKEYRQVIKDLAAVKTELYRMYRRNEFFIRNIYKAYRIVSQMISRHVNRLMRYVKNQSLMVMKYTLRSLIAIVNYMDYVAVRVDRITRCVLNSMARICQTIYSITRDCFENALLKVRDLLERLTSWTFAKLQFMNAFTEKYVMRFIEPVMKKVYKNAVILMTKIKQILSRIPLKNLSYFPFEGRLKTHLEMLKLSIDWQITKYSRLMRETSVQFAERINEYIELQTIKNMIGFFSETAQWMFDNIYTEEMMKAFVQREYKLIIDYMAANSRARMEKWLKLDRFQLEYSSNGLSAQIYTPLIMQDLKSMPQVPDLSQSSILPDGLKKLIPNYNLLSNAYTYGYELPSLMETSQGPWIPDFNSYASVTDKHVITFDKRHFTLEGQCKVLLAGVTNKWNIYLLNNDKKQMQVEAHGRTVLINSDYSVTVSEAHVELPFTMNSLHVVRVGPIIKLQDDILGFSVTSDLESEIHTIGVSGWNHGKVFGLLGNRDNEPYNDFKDKMGNKASDEKFLQAWTVDGQCTISTEKPHFDQNKACNFLFKCPVSPLARCFKKVNPRPFLRMCKQTRKCSKCPVIRVCRAARVYAHHCRMAHVPVRLPHPCRKCKSEVSHKPAADVVVVLSPQCSRRELATLPHKIKDALSSNGITTVRFGLASVGGPEILPLSFTMNKGQLMSENPQHIIDALDRIIATRSRISNEKIDPLTIVKYAAEEYPWKLNAARHMILIQCSLCPAADYKNEISNLLKLKDIKLHHFLPHRFSYSDQIASRRGLGISNERIFSGRHPAGLALPPAMHLPVENNACLKLALNSGGSVFDSKLLLTSEATSSPTLRNKWIKIFANHLAIKSKPRCDCTQPSDECAAFCKLVKKSVSSSNNLCQLEDFYRTAMN